MNNPKSRLKCIKINQKMKKINQKNIKPSVKDNSVLIREDNCWVCGKKFNKDVNKDRRTYHHALPKRWNVVTNLKLPICWGCHQMINMEDEVFKKAYSLLRGTFITTEKIISKKESKFVSNIK